MNIKPILALATIALGIWLNLELHDALVARNVHVLESTRLSGLSSTLAIVGQGVPLSD